MPLSIPKTAPFAEEEIELLNRVVGTATTTQRVWLAGFLAGLEASTAPPQPIAPSVSAEPLTIIYATESGNSEKLAADLAKATRKTGLRPTLIDGGPRRESPRRGRPCRAPCTSIAGAN
jgi:sulfite reductase (NADPH) flavoprotein alpha-component